MPYIPRSTSELRDFAKEFLALFENDPPSRTNDNRFSLAALYDQIANPSIFCSYNAEVTSQILIGIGVLVLTIIKHNEYGGGSPKKGGILNGFSTSSAYILIKDKFNINEQNKFEYEERIVYLAQLKKYIEMIYSQSAFEELTQHKILIKNNRKLIWADKFALQKTISEAITEVLKHSTNQLNNIIHSVPVLLKLVENMQAIVVKHKKDIDNRVNSNRARQVHCMEFILASWQKMNSVPKAKCICSSMLLINLLQIKYDEYANCYYVWSPEHSTLYIDSLNALNQKNINDISLETKISWLTELRNQLIVLENNKGEYSSSLKEVLVKNKNLTAAMLTEQLTQFKNSITTHLKNLETEKNTPSYLSYAVAKTASYGAQAAVTAAAFGVSQRIVASSLTMGLGMFAAPISTAIGTVIAPTLLGSGAMLMILSKLNFLAIGNPVELATAKVFAYLLGKIGDKVGGLAATAVKQTFEASSEDLEDLQKQLPPEDELAFVKWINALLELEEVPDKDKIQIREVVNLKEGEKLIPLHLSQIKSTSHETKSCRLG